VHAARVADALHLGLGLLALEEDDHDVLRLLGARLRVDHRLRQLDVAHKQIAARRTPQQTLKRLHLLAHNHAGHKAELHALLRRLLRLLELDEAGAAASERRALVLALARANRSLFVVAQRVLRGGRVLGEDVGGVLEHELELDELGRVAIERRVSARHIAQIVLQIVQLRLHLFDDELASRGLSRQSLVTRGLMPDDLISD
jgi:hypothetical protein